MLKPREACGIKKNSVRLSSAEDDAHLRVFMTWSIHTWVTRLWRPQNIAACVLKLLDYCNYTYQQHRSALTEVTCKLHYRPCIITVKYITNPHFYDYGSLFRRFPNPNPTPTPPALLTLPNIPNNEPSEYRTFGISSSYHCYSGWDWHTGLVG